MRLTLRLEPAVGRKPPAMFRTEGARAGENVCRGLCPQAAAMRLRLRLEPAVGRKPPALFCTEGARAGEGGGRGRLPAGCRHAAGIAFGTSGWAGAPGVVLHRALAYVLIAVLTGRRDSGTAGKIFLSAVGTIASAKKHAAR